VFCAYCGDTLLANAKFCRTCGKEQPAPDAHPTGTATLDVRTRLSLLEKRVGDVADEVRWNRFHLPLAGLGLSLCAAALALFAFCFLPYVSFNATNTPSLQSAPDTTSYTFTGLQLIDLHAILSDLQTGTGSPVFPKDFTAPDAGWLWLAPLVALSILLLAFFQCIVSRTASPKEPSSEVSISIWIASLALLTILVMIVGQGLIQFDQGTFFHYAAPGYWVFLGTLALALVGGIVQMVAIKRWWTGYESLHKQR
jgi:hypothetical protein